jgi:hypothetical protein
MTPDSFALIEGNMSQKIITADFANEQYFWTGMWAA